MWFALINKNMHTGNADFIKRLRDIHCGKQECAGVSRIAAVFTGALCQVFVVGEKNRFKTKPLPTPPLIRGGSF